MTKTQTTSRAQIRKIEDQLEPARSVDLQIRALGRWNEQMSERVVTRQNGYASYSMLKLMMNRSLGG